MEGQMTFRQRILCALTGQFPDKIPWIPRLQIWYDAHSQRNELPEKYRGWSLHEIENDLNMGNPARNGAVFGTELRGVDVSRHTEGDLITTEYRTPFGSVNTQQQKSSILEHGGISAALNISHLIKGIDDYKPVEYIIEHTDIIPVYEQYLEYDRQVADDGLPLVSIGPDPMYRILQDLVGYNQAFYHLVDYRVQIAHLLEVLKEQAMRIQEVVLASPAVMIQHGEHFDSQMTPPRLYQTYMLPHFQAFADRLHAHGKFLVGHADADTSRILPLLKDSGFDMLECFVTAPMVPITLAEARRVLGDQVVIWGGIPSVLLCDPYSDAQFDAYMEELFATITPGKAFILGVADNIMAEAHLDRIARVSDMVDRYGRCPITGLPASG